MSVLQGIGHLRCCGSATDYHFAPGNLLIGLFHATSAPIGSCWSTPQDRKRGRYDGMLPQARDTAAVRTARLATMQEPLSEERPTSRPMAPCRDQTKAPAWQPHPPQPARPASQVLSGSSIHPLQIGSRHRHTCSTGGQAKALHCCPRVCDLCCRRGRVYPDVWGARQPRGPRGQ